MLPLAAPGADREKRDTEKTTETTTTTTTTFTPESRTKVERFFDHFRDKPHGLPPEWTMKFKENEVPAAWRTSRINPGFMVTENERQYLVMAPPDLVAVLPAISGDVHYYVAGSNVVAVDRNYRVVDSIHIPTIKFMTDENATAETTTETTVTFTPEYRTKLERFFDRFRDKPHGLPAEWVTKMKMKEIPGTWTTTRITPGMTIPESERTYLVEAPSDLTAVLPASSGDVHYYVAGGNVIAVDKSYRVVDSVRIPTIKFTREDKDD